MFGVQLLRIRKVVALTEHPVSESWLIVNEVVPDVRLSGRFHLEDTESWTFDLLVASAAHTDVVA